MHWMFMPLRRYADFSGRSRRMEFWMWFLFQSIVSFIIWMVLTVLFIAAAVSAVSSVSTLGDSSYASEAAQRAAILNRLSTAGGIGIAALIILALSAIYGIVMFIPNLAVGIRRLHDSNRTGWWAVAPMGTMILGYAMFFIFALVGASAGGEPNPGLIAAAFAIWMIMILVAGGFGITVLVFYFLDGTPGPNQYGPDPKAGERSFDQTFA